MVFNFDYFVKWLLLRVICFTGMAMLGIALIGFGLWGGPSDPLLNEWAEKTATFVGSLVTFMGTAATATSIYFHRLKPTNPSPESYWSAPIVIIACALAAIYLIRFGSISGHIVNGFALLGIAGALYRLQPNPQRAAGFE